MPKPKTKPKKKALVREEVGGGQIYEYYPLGKYIVSAPGICGGRPTFKYTRLEVAVILDLLAAGWTVERLVREYSKSRLTPEAVREALQLAKQALLQRTPVATSSSKS
jgi:uncharacterized protein (DUF433 family)